MRRLDQLLGYTFEQKEIVRAAQVWQALRRWNEIVGEALAKKSWPDKYERGTVYVAVAGSAWAQELRMLKPKILSRIDGMIKDRGLVSDIRFGVRDLPDPTEVGPTVKPKYESTAKDLSFQELKEKILNRAKDET